MKKIFFHGNTFCFLSLRGHKYIVLYSSFGHPFKKILAERLSLRKQTKIFLSQIAEITDENRKDKNGAIH